MTGNNRIEIPPEAFEPKPHFPDFASAQAVSREALDWIKSGLPVYEWPGHTHTCPTLAETADIEFIADFTLAKKAPCPCCTPYHGKFKHGFLAWFPQTHLIRIMGTDCFKRMNPEGYRAALDRQHVRKGQEAVLDVLSRNMPRLADAKRKLQDILPLAEHLDGLQKALGVDLNNKRRIDLWGAVRNEGQLQIKIRESVEHDKAMLGTYARIDGYRLLDPRREKIALRIKNALAEFDKISLPVIIKDANFAERAIAYKTLQKAKRLAESALKDLDECRRFLSPATVSTIRTWGARADATAPVYMKLEGRQLLVGWSEASARPVSLSPDFDKATPILDL